MPVTFNQRDDWFLRCIAHGNRCIEPAPRGATCPLGAWQRTNHSEGSKGHRANAMPLGASERWPDGPYCPHCGSFAAKRLEGKSHRAGLVQCNDCREQYTVTVGTVFERSKVPLHKWLLCNHLLCASKKGMSAKQIERMLGVTYKTAWFMCHRLREAMDGANGDGPLGGPDKVVEADETYVGGKAKNRAFREPAPKKPVVALVERDG